MGKHVSRLRTVLEGVRAGGGAKAVERHKGRGKLTARERVDTLLDPGSPFLELSPLAGHELYDDAVPAGTFVSQRGKKVHPCRPAFSPTPFVPSPPSPPHPSPHTPPHTPSQAASSPASGACLAPR